MLRDELISKIKIIDMNTFVDAINESHDKFRVKSWWRGHFDNVWKLQPSVFRRIDKTIYTERSNYIQFQSEAKYRYEKCPDMKDYLGWLTLMQHYSMATRLLDWSMSPLIALYFAVYDDALAENKKENDSVLWTINPGALNNCFVASDTILSAQNIRDYHYEIVKEAFEPSSVTTEKVIAFAPEHFDMRHMIQRSCFTLHGSNEQLEVHKNARQFLVGYVIPSDKKNIFREYFNRFDISGAYLYPDLTNLAKVIMQCKYKIS